MIKKIIMISLLTTFLSMGLQGAQATKESIAVIDFDAQNVSKMDAVVVADFFRTALVNLNVYKVIDRKNMEVLLQEQGLQVSGLTDCTDQECVAKIGKILNVKEMVMGSLSKLMGVYYITANIIDVETAEIKVSKRAKVVQESKLAESVDRLAYYLMYPDQDTSSMVSMPQTQPQVQQQVQEPASVFHKPVSARKGPKPTIFFDFFTGNTAGKMDLTFENIVQGVSASRLGLFSNYVLYDNYNFTDLEIVQAAPPRGFRFGFYDKYVGLDFELSTMKHSLEQQDTNYTVNDTIDKRLTFIVDDYLDINSFLFTIDLFFKSHSKVLFPYFGGGLGFSVNTVTSPYIWSYIDGIYQQELDDIAVGLVVKGFAGMRLMLGDVLSVFAEARVMMNRFTFDRNLEDEEDIVIMKLNQTIFGASLLF
ncbi:CsgG/HfaB family protein [bacterium]